MSYVQTKQLIKNIIFVKTNDFSMKKYLLVLLSVLAAYHALYAQEWEDNSRESTTAVLFSPDSRYLVAGGFLRIYNAENGTPLYSSPESDKYTTNIILQARISNDGRYLAAIKNNRVEVIELGSRNTIKTIRASKIAAADIGPDNKTLAYVCTNGELVFYDIPSRTEVSSHDLGRMRLNTIVWADKSNKLAIGTRGGVLILYDIEKKEGSYPSGFGGDAILDIEFSDDSRYLGVSLRSGDVKLINAENGKPVCTIKAHTGPARTLAFHPSGKYIATSGEDKQITIWAIPSGTQVDSWPGHDRSVITLDFSPDGTMLASGCYNVALSGTADTRVWKTANHGIDMSIAELQTDDVEAENQDIIPVQAVPESDNLEATSAAAQKRLALVIGNSMYMYGGILSNPENDANDIGRKLQQLGFDVMLFNNLDQKNFKKAIDDFGMNLKSYDVGLFYYAGHGIQVKGNNYLIPVDANLSTENEVEYDCVNAGRLLAKMEDAGSTTNIIILDACRDNPFERSWRRATHGMGLAFMTAPAGSLISYATSPGATASDGSGRNGLFTSALLTYIDEPRISILEMFQKVRTYVREQSEGQQVPWESTSLEGNFYFK